MRKRLPEYVSVPLLAARKTRREPIVMVTAYDAPQARLANAAGVDSILVGDSVGMTTLGHDTTLPVTLDQILHHTAAVRRGMETPLPGTCPDADPTPAQVSRGARHALLIADLPFGSYGASPEEGVRAGIRLLSEAGAHAVKLEGAGPIILETVRRLVDIGVPVMGHLGLTPQSIHRFGGFKLQGKTDAAAEALLADAAALADAGAFGMVLEVIPAALAQRITEASSIPTIGIGAGPHCDGQVQVLHDLIGLTPGPVLKHARRYADVATQIQDALSSYVQDTRTRDFPTEDNSF